MDFIDLHTHSTASDGSLTPAELMRAAHAAGLRAVALTDHDSLGGLDEAAAEAQTLGLEFVPGIELSLTHDRGSAHLLGYFIDPAKGGFGDWITELGLRRRERNRLMFERLSELVGPISEADVLESTGTGIQPENLGRPHVAALLVKRGVVKTFQEVFDRYLGKGKPAYIAKSPLPLEDGIARIHAAGGLAVLAHPGYAVKDRSELEPLVAGLVEAGLDGLECLYSDHSDADTASFVGMAQRYKLAVTGGSDFHGAPQPAIQLRSGRGNLRVVYSLLEDLKARLG